MDRNKTKSRLFVWYSFMWIFLILALYVCYFLYFPANKPEKPAWISLIAASVAILLCVCKNLEILFHDENSSFLKKIISYFYNGVQVFFKRQIKYLIGLSVVLSILFFILKAIFAFPLLQNFDTPIGAHFVSFIVGAFLCGACVFVSNFVSTRTNTRISHSPFESTNSVLRLAYNSGVVVSMGILGFCLIGLTLLFKMYSDPHVLCTFAFGACFASIIYSIGTIVAKRAVQNANHVVLGFFEQMQDNDRRNPLLLLNGISKSSFGLSSLAVDMFTSFSMSIVAAMLIGDMFYSLRGMLMPLIIASTGVFVNIFVILLTRINKINNPIKTLFISTFIAIVLFSASSYILLKNWMSEFALGLSICILVGALCGYAICFINVASLFAKYKPARNVANSAIVGIASAMIQTLKESFMGVFGPVFLIAFLIIVTFLIPGGIQMPTLGLYGTSLAVLSVLSTMGIMVTINLFAMVSNNVNIVSKTYEEDYEVLPNDKMLILNRIGHSTILLGKNFINFSAILASIVAMIAFTFISYVDELDILNPFDMASLFFGCAIPFLYCGLIMGGISKISSKLVYQVKAQFRNFPQILRQEMRPDYEKCVDISAVNSSVQVIVYTLLVLTIFALIGIYLKAEAMAAFVFGIILTSLGLVFSSTNSSLIAKSAKKYFESEFINAQYSEEYGAISAVDAVCSIVKDLIAPCLNLLLKLLAIIALFLSPVLVSNL